MLHDLLLIWCNLRMEVNACPRHVVSYQVNGDTPQPRAAVDPFQLLAVAGDRVVAVAGASQRVVSADAELLRQINKAVVGRRADGGAGVELPACLGILALGIPHRGFN